MEHLSLPGVAPLPMLTVGLMLSVLTGCSPLRNYEALLILSDIGAATAPSRWKIVTPEPSRTPVTYTIAGRQHTGDLYLPGKDVPEAGVVLVPGAVPRRRRSLSTERSHSAIAT